MRFAITLLASLCFATAAPIPEIPRKIPPAGEPLNEEQTMEVKLALADLATQYQIDPDRIALGVLNQPKQSVHRYSDFVSKPNASPDANVMLVAGGFSMGGAGAWHIGVSMFNCVQ